MYTDLSCRMIKRTIIKRLFGFNIYFNIMRYKFS